MVVGRGVGDCTGVVNGMKGGGSIVGLVVDGVGVVVGFVETSVTEVVVVMIVIVSSKVARGLPVVVVVAVVGVTPGLEVGT